MMHFSNDPHNLPNCEIMGSTPLLSICRKVGCFDYCGLAAHVLNLPYRRTSNLDNPSLVLEEKCGTCSTKHALLSAVALELKLVVELRIGIYEMDGINTPGVEKTLTKHSLACIPEAHCYLAYDGKRIDLTRDVGGRSIDLEILHEESIEPYQIGNYKDQIHKDFIKKWSTERKLNTQKVWTVREECIKALSQPVTHP